MNNEIKHPYFRIFADILRITVEVLLLFSGINIWLKLLPVAALGINFKDIYNTVQYIREKEETE